MKSKKCCTSSEAHSNEFKNVVTTRSSDCAPTRTRRARSITHARLACHGNTTHTKCLPCAPFGHVHVTKRPCSKAQHLIPKCILRAHKPASRGPLHIVHALQMLARRMLARRMLAGRTLAGCTLALRTLARPTRAGPTRDPPTIQPHSIGWRPKEERRAPGVR